MTSFPVTCSHVLYENRAMLFEVELHRGA